jgi:hypothetical protein
VRCFMSIQRMKTRAKDIPVKIFGLLSLMQGLSPLNPKHLSVANSRVFTEKYAEPASAGQSVPRRILGEELERARAPLLTLKIGFFVSYAELQQKGATTKNPHISLAATIRETWAM